MDKREAANLAICVEEFLAYYHKAWDRKAFKALDSLYFRYPEVACLAFNAGYIESKIDPADAGCRTCHPVTIDSTRMTERRVMDMVAYLLCQERAPAKYRDRLHNQISFTEVFNYILSRYQRDYDREELWKKFFLSFGELQEALQARHIGNLMELEYYAAEYFDPYVIQVYK